VIRVESWKSRTLFNDGTNETGRNLCWNELWLENS